MRVLAVSDTHAPRFWKRLPPAVARHAQDAELILHAGDVCVPSVLDELAAFAPVVAVAGNNDGAEIAEWGARETAELTVAGVRVAMLHDSGARTGRIARLRRRFPDADLVVFGHSHIPWDDTGPDGLRIVNPGSPTDKRRQPHGTLALLELVDGRVSAQIVPVS